MFLLSSVYSRMNLAFTLADYCYEDMFYDCTGLTDAPDLPATSLEYYCYDWMFNGCSKLNYVKALFIDHPATNTDYTRDWLEGVATSGEFVMNAAATWDPTTSVGPDCVPDGWTVTKVTE